MTGFYKTVLELSENRRQPMHVDSTTLQNAITTIKPRLILNGIEEIISDELSPENALLDAVDYAGTESCNSKTRKTAKYWLEQNPETTLKKEWSQLLTYNKGTSCCGGCVKPKPQPYLPD